MEKIRLLNIIFLATAFLSPLSLKAEETLTFTGEARTLDGRLSYIEQHQVHELGTLRKSETKYIDGKGKMLASFSSTYRLSNHDSLYLPIHEYQDLLRNSRNGITLNKDKQLSAFVIDRDGETQNVVKKGPNRVAGQAFHYYISDNLDRLIRGETIEMDLVRIDTGGTFGFRVKRDQEKTQTMGKIHLVAEAQNWFFRLFAPALKVTYSTESKRLLYYQGPSNILSPNGDRQKVEITYAYGDQVRKRIAKNEPKAKGVGQ
jgi:hypothetical protein